MAVPPVDTVYHLYCPFAPPEAVKVNVFPAHALAPVVVGGGEVDMVADTCVRALSHVPLFIETK